MLDEGGYSKQWRRLRRSNRIAFGMLIGAFPFIGLLMVVERQLLDATSGEGPIGALGALAYLAVLVSVGAFGGSNCPRCERAFFNNGWTRNAFSYRCMNCGLPWGASFAEARSGLTAAGDNAPPLRARRIAIGVLIGIGIVFVSILLGVMASRLR